MNDYMQFYILPVVASKLDAYRWFALETGKIWHEHGALAFAEFIADDAKSGVHTSFPQAVNLEVNEAVVAIWEGCKRIARRAGVEDVRGKI